MKGPLSSFHLLDKISTKSFGYKTRMGNITTTTMKYALFLKRFSRSKTATFNFEFFSTILIAVKIQLHRRQ